MKLRTGILAALFVIPMVSLSANADETLIEKAQNKIGDMKVEHKKNVRKHKRNKRNAAGRGSFKKDAEDLGNNVKDDLDNAAQKAKRKMD